MNQEKPCPMHVNTGNGERYCEQGPDGHEGTCIGNRDEGTYLTLLRAAIPLPLRAAILTQGFYIEEVRDWSVDGSSWKVAIVKMPEQVHVDLVKEIS